MPMPLVHLLDEDPDLGVDIGAVDLPRARRLALGVEDRLPSGPWSAVGDDDSIGALILDGLLLREVTVADRPSAELMGTGDVLLPRGEDAVTFVTRTVSWTALGPIRVAWMGPSMLAASSQWPCIARVLLQRSERRISRGITMQSLARLPRVEDRVLGELWLLAERWGRVTADGVTLPLPLTHRTLGKLIGAERSSVTGAVGALSESGRISRVSVDTWVLHGRPDFAPDTSGDGQRDGLPPDGAVG